jgi:hypothetical protein
MPKPGDGWTRAGYAMGFDDIDNIDKTLVGTKRTKPSVSFFWSVE